MRDHQIVISLKPDQFQQIQKLARESGAKTVGAFLRERLLSTLGVETEATMPTSPPNWQLIGGQIRRLHRELQLFIAESSDTPEDDRYDPDDAELESVLRRAVSEVVEIEPPQYSQQYSQQPLQQQLQQQQQQQTQEQYQQQPLTALPQAPVQQSQRVESPVAAQVTPTAAPAPEEDALEDLADRAFAISPRLGALDPLQELLEDSLLSPVDEGEDDDDFDYDESEVATTAPKSRAARRPALPSDGEADTTSDTASSDTGPQPPPKRGAIGEDEYYDDDSEGLSNPPPISGGPPPRKR